MRSLSQKTKYALRALQHLARERDHGPVLISTLAEQESIPKKFLELILLELKNHGVLHSKKGKGGGYTLRLAPEDVTIGQIVRLFDGPLALVPCVSDRNYRRCEDCRDETTCALRVVLREVRDATAKILDRTSIADLVKAELVRLPTPVGDYCI